MEALPPSDNHLDFGFDLVTDAPNTLAEVESPALGDSTMPKPETVEDFLVASPSLKDSASTGDSPASLSPPPLQGPNNASSRRPPRKSTLTQQQKNQKRQRATQDQLAMLEVEFNKNPTPTAVVREQIAQDINMTERSVQIWFQNRRAKIKNLAKKSFESGEDCDGIPDSMRKYLALQALESGRPLSSESMAAKASSPFGPGLAMHPDSQAKVWIQHLHACRSLSIGTWKRISQTAMDLVVFYSPAKAMFTYYINAESSGFKIEYPFSYIKNISLDSGDVSNNAEGAVQSSGGLIVELMHPPNFSMDPGSGGFMQCRDFTENQQASQVLTHHLGGHPKVLAGQLAKLVSLDSFRNRHRVPDTSAIAISAPVSPVGIRPASQPNHLLHPHMMNRGQDNGTHMGPPQSRLGHKRQRSRSVPVACDFSQLRRPMPPFMQHHELGHHPVNMPHVYQQHIFAPIPQHAQPPMSAPLSTNGFAPFNSDLNINVSAANFDFDFRNGPMSATTINSTEVEPNYFTLAPASETYSTPTMHTPYNGSFMSPMANGINFVQTPASPFSTLSHGDPIIANQSPPLGSYDRSASADVYQANSDQAAFQDEGLHFNDMYQKQPFTLPFRSPVTETAPEPEFDFQNMVHFNGPESESLSPDSNRFSGSG